MNRFVSKIWGFLNKAIKLKTEFIADINIISKQVSFKYL